MKLLMNHSWPGNVRELKNVIERAVLLAAQPVLQPRDLVIGAPLHPESRTSFTLPAEGIVLEEVERDLIIQALERFGGNLTKAARILGITKDTLRYRIKKFGLQTRTQSQTE